MNLTPAEMAEWLELELNIQAGAGFRVWQEQTAVVAEIAAWLRRQPTDAQKIEALHAERMAVMCRMGGALSDEFHHHREALRLLGMPTGIDAP